MISIQPTPAPPRKILAVALGLIAALLVAGGVQLIALGGSPYYALAGAAVGLSAWWTFRGDGRGVTIYLLMLAATFAWALVEGGLDPWRLQSRVLAPAVLGIWVAWPLLRARPRTASIAAVALLVGFGGWLFTVNQPDPAPAQGTATAATTPDGSGEWRNYGNTLAGTRHTPVSQITPANVGKLERAWTFRTGVNIIGIGMETTPVMIGDMLYLCTSNNIVFALDAETGQKRWSVDPKTKTPPAATCRGVSYYEVPGATGQCARRIIFGTTDARLMAIDAADGSRCRDFGKDGSVDLKKGMGHVYPGYYYITSAPTIVRGKIVLGGWVNDGQYVGEPSGVIRAFDATTGAFAWAWDMDRPDDHREQTYSRGTANSWGIMSADESLGLVYAPTGNSTPDYWGAHRSKGSEKYSASVVAIDVETGAARWHFQTAHHDVWDYDVSAQPTLVDLPVGGKTIPALVQGTKRGEVFLLDRRTGKPIAPVEERAVPQGAAPGDWLTPTQPFSTMPAFDRTLLTERHMWGLTPLDQLWCRIKFLQARYEGPMTPPGVKPSITYPSYLGGINWGGVSGDPDRRLMVVNWSRMANYTSMVPRADADRMGISISKDGSSHVGMPVPQEGTPFALRTGAFLSPLGAPCTEPPFGKIAVVDLVSRKVVWERPLGTSEDSGLFDKASHVPLPMGVPNAGGSITTRGGLIFIGATQEKAFRAFDLKTGALLWHSRLPAGAHASPMSFVSPKSGRQFVVVAAGGSATLHSGAGDYIVAFALPKGK